ncbi:MAG: hypothetical protein MUF00_04160 [Gemmatimonadaceae bacterium]|nr:hypothetical protein [Gemmatimonadaceae bacterium]
MSRVRFAATLVLACTTVAPLPAQVTELSRTSLADAAQLTFGHLCDDRFVLRNDGTQSVTLAYQVAKSTEQTAITLGAREVVELASASRQPLELWKDGRRIARAEKERRKCKDVQGTAAVQVSPLEVSSTERPRQPWVGYGPGWGMGWGAGPWFDPWFGGPWGAWGVNPWRTGFVGVPVIVTGRGGRRR